MPVDDADYYRRRAEQERVRAKDNDNPVIAEVHRTLAELYEARLLADEPVQLRAVRA